MTFFTSLGGKVETQQILPGVRLTYAIFLASRAFIAGCGRREIVARRLIIMSGR